MITIYDLSINLVNNSDPYFIKMMLDFLNNFMNTFSVLPKKEILYRINRLDYIGFSKDIYRVYDEDATFGSGIYYYVAVNNKYKFSSKDVLKSLIYHELIHCLSCHYENHEIIGGLCLDINNGTLFDEIMTEYYSQILLGNENIYNYRKNIIKNEILHKEFIFSYGKGYSLYASLGKIYNFIYNNKLMKAKFIDNRPFIKEFNRLINSTEIKLDYNKFINEVDFHKRLYDITLIFIKYLIDYYQNNGLNREEIIYEPDVTTFINLLTKEELNGIIVPNLKLSEFIYNELYNYIYKRNKLFIR